MSAIWHPAPKTLIAAPFSKILRFINFGNNVVISWQAERQEQLFKCYSVIVNLVVKLLYCLILSLKVSLLSGDSDPTKWVEPKDEDHGAGGRGGCRGGRTGFE